MNKIDKLLARWNKKGKTQIIILRSEIKMGIRTGSTEMKGIVRECYEQLYTSKLVTLNERDKFLET